MKCALCGHEAASLGGSVHNVGSPRVDLCHGCTSGFDCRTGPSCYERWTVYGERGDR